MYSSLITINKNVYQIKFGILSLILLSEILYIQDREELLRRKFYLSDVRRLDNTSLTFEEKKELFKELMQGGEGAKPLDDVLSESYNLSLGEYKEITKEVYKKLFIKGVGEIGLSLNDFNSMAPAEIDLAYWGYLKRKELEANCSLIALRKAKDNKATLFSLLGGQEYNYISETERKEILNSLNIKE